MGILGLTHDENGVALEKLPVTMKVAIGEGPDPERRRPSARCIISFLSGKSFVGNPCIGSPHRRSPRFMARSRLNWESSSSTTTHAKSFHRSTLCGRREAASATANWYRLQMAAGHSTKCKHSKNAGSTLRGSLGLATRKYVDGPQKGQPVEGCGAGCPELEQGKLSAFRRFLLHLGEVPDVRRNLPIAHGRQDIGPQPVECGSATA